MFYKASETLDQLIDSLNDLKAINIDGIDIKLSKIKNKIREDKLNKLLNK